MNNNHHQMHDEVEHHNLMSGEGLGDDLEDHRGEGHHHNMIHHHSSNNSSPGEVGMDRPTVVSMSS